MTCVLSGIPSHLFIEGETTSGKRHWFATKLPRNQVRTKGIRMAVPVYMFTGFEPTKHETPKPQCQRSKDTSVGGFREFGSLSSVCLRWCGGVGRLPYEKYCGGNQRKSLHESATMVFNHVRVTNHKCASTVWWPVLSSIRRWPLKSLQAPGWKPMCRFKTQLIQTNLIFPLQEHSSESQRRTANFLSGWNASRYVPSPPQVKLLQPQPDTPPIA